VCSAQVRGEGVLAAIAATQADAHARAESGHLLAPDDSLLSRYSVDAKFDVGATQATLRELAERYENQQVRGTGDGHLPGRRAGPAACPMLRPPPPPADLTPLAHVHA
jgi:hypothetical protein